jgi:hypothetical protein
LWQLEAATILGIKIFCCDFGGVVEGVGVGVSVLDRSICM